VIDSIVIIPTYNEKENAEAIIREVMALEPEFHVLIVDDGSPDGTAEIVKSLQSEFEGRLFLEQRKGKLGLGTAYIHGFRWSLARGYEFIFEIDADFSHNPKDLPRLRDACKTGGADLAIGSRYVVGVNVVNWPMGRVLMSWFASHYVRLVTGMQINDTTAGFKCYRDVVLKTINLDKIDFVGYAFQIEMKFLAWKFGFRIVEIPIIFTDRTKGESKMSPGIFKEAVLGVLQMKIQSWFRDFRRK
jgi:dolichol-phosphate mannosyltransferase